MKWPTIKTIIISILLIALAQTNLAAQCKKVHPSKYPSNKKIQCKKYIPKTDVGRKRNESKFAKMYGRTENEVRKHLAKIYWMPEIFSDRYPMLVTRINHVNDRLQRISDQLENLVRRHPDYIRFLDNPGGTFAWRNIQNTHRKSLHSFGIAIDINPDYTNYWMRDTGIKTNHLYQADRFSYRNNVPQEIVSIFENNGFIWGGKWQHYDTMHFEYRPELL